MKASKLRDLTKDELTRKFTDLKGELFNLRFQLATGQLENPMRIRDVKKNIAQTQTIIRERELLEQKN
ncbi:MAG: 50S ribosomal protein L29 [Firmicutes bacterium HGW-Firmicutes-12]|nr:MAG: 50S ribosomal protein L29 [Firmicutes bacterium HGW-Firmicutes-12]